MTKYFFKFKSLRSQLLFRTFLILASVLILIGINQNMFMKNFIYENKALSISGQVSSIPLGEWEERINSIKTKQTEVNKLVFFGATVALIDKNGNYTVLSKDANSGNPPKFTKQFYLHALKNNRPLEYKVIFTGLVTFYS